jgi:predicted amidophosphoribosyltransferase
MPLEEKEVAEIKVVCPNGHIVTAMETVYYLLFSGQQKYCVECGTKLEEKKLITKYQVCSKCKSPINTTWKFCPCGEKL